MKHIKTKLATKGTPACNCIPCWLETSQQIIHLSFHTSFNSVHQIILWITGSMRQRTVLMYVEIGCFLTCLCGWILICSTLATEYWTFSEVGSVVLTTGNYYSNLWMDCVSDTTGVSDCKYYPSMMDLSGKTVDWIFFFESLFKRCIFFRTLFKKTRWITMSPYIMTRKYFGKFCNTLKMLKYNICLLINLDIFCHNTC